MPTIPLSEDGRRDQDAGPGGLVTAIAPDVTDGTEPGQPPDGPGTPGRADRPGWLGGLGRRLGGLGRRLARPAGWPGRPRHLPWTAGMRRALRWLLPAAVFAVFGMALFVAYLSQARGLAATSDSGSQALQAWDMMHGNPLLRGWSLSDVAFYSTELPEYMVVEVTRGLNGDTVHVATALSYTLVVLLGGLLAKGQATGWRGLARFLIAAGIMLAPPLHLGNYLFLSGPDHTGTQAAVLLIWLLLDRRRERWWIPPAAAILLTWAQVGDMLVLYEAVLPLVVVCAVRLYRRPQPWIYQASLIVAAVAAAAAARLILSAIRNAGGFVVRTPVASFATAGQITVEFWFKVRRVLEVFGADFLGMPVNGSVAVPLIHLAALVVVAWAVIAGVRRFGAARLVDQVLIAAFGVLLGAFLLGTKQGANEIVGLLPIGAALAGRMLGDRFLADPAPAGPAPADPAPADPAPGGSAQRADLPGWPNGGRLIPALAVLLGLSAGVLAYNASRPYPVTENQRVAAFLVRHHLRYGLAGFWQASSITVFSGNRAQVRPVREVSGQIVTTTSENDATWYNPRIHYANFIIFTQNGGCLNVCLSFTDLSAIFGAPAATYAVGRYSVVVWHANLLSRLRTLYWCNDVWPWASKQPPSGSRCPD